MACILNKLTSQSSDKKLKFKQTKEDIFRNLRRKTSNEQYQRALDTISKSSDSVVQAFLTICETFLDSAGKPVRVFVVVAAETYGAHLQILDQLNSRGPRVKPTEDPQQAAVVLLFCPVVTRVGSCVETAVRKVPVEAGSKAVVLILMHHTWNPDMVPNQTLWRERFSCITHEVRVLYHETKNGLLECPKNREAVHTLQGLCDSFMDKTPGDGLTLDTSYEIIEQEEVDRANSEKEEVDGGSSENEEVDGGSSDHECPESEDILSSFPLFPYTLMGRGGSSTFFYSGQYKFI